MAVRLQPCAEVLESSILPSRARSTRPWRAGSIAATRASRSRWARWAMRTTTPCVRAFSPRSSANSSTGGVFRRWPRRGVKSLASSRASTAARRIHAALGYKSPANFEKRNHVSRKRTWQRLMKPKLFGHLRAARFVGVARYPSPPLEEREKNHIRHHQPKKLTVRESGVRPKLRRLQSVLPGYWGNRDDADDWIRNPQPIVSFSRPVSPSS